jgi:hypothetical protein
MVGGTEVPPAQSVAQGFSPASRGVITSGQFRAHQFFLTSVTASIDANAGGWLAGGVRP